MKPVIDFLGSDAWQGIQGIIALVALILSLRRPRDWAEKHPGTKWALRVPWTLLLVLVGIGAGLGVGLKSGDAYRGLALALVSVCLALGIHLIGSRRQARKLGVELDETSAKLRAELDETTAKLGAELNETAAERKRLLNVLRRLTDLQQASTDFRLDDRKVVHRIDGKGNGSLYEEFTIVPGQNEVFFYVIGPITFIEDPEGEAEVTVTANNLSDDTPLTVIEIDRSNKHVQFAIMIDPPSSATNPRRIAINCTRKLIWEGLLQNNADDGAFRLIYPSDTYQIELLAPPGKTWKAFQRTPEVGSVSMEPSSDCTRIVWTIASPAGIRYSYKVFVN